MNATVRTEPLTAQLIASARELATWHEDQGRSGTATAIFNLVSEIETLREAAKGSLVIVQQVQAGKVSAELRAQALLTILKKLQPVIDEEIEQRQTGGNEEDWAALQSLSDDLHAAIRMARP